MSMIKIQVWQLQKINIGIECCDCALEIDGRPELEVWVKLNNLIYCPRCARNEGLY